MDKNSGQVISTLADPSILVTSNNTFILTEINTASGCSKKDSITITAISRPAPVISGIKNVCENAVHTYSVINSAGNTYNWSVTGGTIISGQNTSAIQVKWGVASNGLLKVTESNTSGCTDSGILYIAVIAQPIAEAGKDQIICEGESVKLGATAKSGISYSWTSNPPGFTSIQADPVLTPKVTTIYYLKETNNAAACESIDSVIITVNPRAIASFGFNGTCFGENTVFSDSSKTSGTDSIVSWNWDFGNGISSKLQNPVRPFGAIGNYNIKLKITSSNGCVDSVSKVIEIVPEAKAKFSWVIVSGRNVQFSPDDSTHKSYEWDFGDGSSSTLRNPVYTFAADGKYRVALKVQNGPACKDEYSDSILIKLTGINTTIEIQNISTEFYPNPFKDELTITYNLLKNTDVNISIYNILGQKVIQLHELSQPEGRHTVILKNGIKDLKPGSYLIHIQMGGFLTAKHLLKL